jgi:hypothetical protein
MSTRLLWAFRVVSELPTHVVPSSEQNRNRCQRHDLALTLSLPQLRFRTLPEPPEILRVPLKDQSA